MCVYCLSALWGMMSYEQIMLVTLGGKYQFMHFVQDAFGLVRGDHFRNGLASNDIIPQSANSKHTLSLGFHFCSNFTAIYFAERTFTLSFTMHFLSFFLTPTLATVTIGLVMLLSILRREVMYDYDSATSA